MVRLLMLDLDDTLLNDDLELSSVNKATLIKAQQQGIKVALSSGRPTFAMEALAEELELGKYGGYLISFNGAAIMIARMKDRSFICLYQKEHWGNFIILAKSIMCICKLI
ncbi:putative haloacid dehalogenase-like hydrolase [Listeria grandensis FSL F6-0971]|uniref:Putative haloacid dehalogenase-like hydrolase n=1 Tax=Listeria grandensis FSL F6-0971 TaxID=1265819 RepID=W7BJE1_9LIST|nr:putative haloacid dehalogenase-like hydrolase [Listeria grandensis FSL F6-0971]